MTLPFIDDRIEESDEHDETQDSDDHPNDSIEQDRGHSIMTSRIFLYFVTFLCIKAYVPDRTNGSSMNDVIALRIL